MECFHPIIVLCFTFSGPRMTLRLFSLLHHDEPDNIGGDAVLPIYWPKDSFATTNVSGNNAPIFQIGLLLERKLF